MNSRRHFIATALGSAFAAPLLAQEAKLSYKGENLHFGLVTYMWGADWDLATLIKNCETAEVLGVELRVEHAHQVEPTMNASSVRRCGSASRTRQWMCWAWDELRVSQREAGGGAQAHRAGEDVCEAQPRHRRQAA